jgi:hypothetical protein
MSYHSLYHWTNADVETDKLVGSKTAKSISLVILCTMLGNTPFTSLFFTTDRGRLQKLSIARLWAEILSQDFASNRPEC